MPSMTTISAGHSSKPKWKTAFGLNGFQSSSAKYGKNYPIWEVLDFDRQTGFDGIEILPGWPPQMGEYPAPDDSRKIGALRRLYDGFGLQIFSIQTSADKAFDPDAEVRKKWLANWHTNARFAKAAGAECIGIWPGGPLGNQTIDQAIDHLADSFRQVWKIAGDLGLTASFEIEPPFVFNTEEHIMQVLAKVPGCKTMLDPSHYDLMSGGKGQVSAMLKRIGVRNIGYVHFTDCDGTLRDGGTSRHLPCGDGHVDIDATLATLRDGGFHGWIMIDAWETPDPYEACVKGLAAINRART
jgi:sugar phosphate isomerase/epimerase